MIFISHNVKCIYCNTSFDRDKVAYVSPKSRRYGHADCYLRLRASDPTLPELEITDPNDIVTCAYCKQSFNKKEVEFVKVGNKYSHKTCYELEEKREKTDAEKLEIYIMQLYKTDFVSPRIKKQINQFVNDYGYSYSGIHKALVFHHEIRKNPVDTRYTGIGIVPYVYQDAYNYYYALWLAQQKNENKDIQKYIPKEWEIHIPVPQRKVKKRNLFSFLDEEEEMNE